MIFDGTTAQWDVGNYEHNKIGPPIERTIKRILKDLKAGKRVKIFTARVSGPDADKIRKMIEKWCVKYIGQPLEVTNIKDHLMRKLIDDRAEQVEMNSGKPITAPKPKKKVHK